METTHSKEKRPIGWVKAVLMAGLIVGSLDISAAIIQTLLNKRDPVKMFQFIASGIFGRQSFSGGLPCAISGLLFHYIIALGWTVLFFLIYPRIKFMAESKILTGLLYGCFVWLIMNQIVLPLSNTPPIPFTISGSIVAALILIGAIGVPLALLAQRFYSRK